MHVLTNPMPATRTLGELGLFASQVMAGKGRNCYLRGCHVQMKMVNTNRASAGKSSNRFSLVALGPTASNARARLSFAIHA